MNPDVIAWLRSPEGEAWSRNRIRQARSNEIDATPVFYQVASRDRLSPLLMPGFFSIREG